MAIIIARVESDDPDAWYADHMKRDVAHPNARVWILEVEDPDAFFQFLSNPELEGPRKYRPSFWVVEELEKSIGCVPSPVDVGVAYRSAG